MLDGQPLRAEPRLIQLVFRVSPRHTKIKAKMPVALNILRSAQKQRGWLPESSLVLKTADWPLLGYGRERDTVGCGEVR